MSEDLNNVPRRLRRFYRKGEPVPADEREENYPAQNNPPKRNTNPISSGENHEENEPWMRARPPAPSASTESSYSSPRSRRNERRESARNSSQNSQPAPKQGLFSRVLQNTSTSSVTPMDHALGLHDKEKFEEKPPRASEQALNQTPPLPQSARAQKEIQSALQELRALAKNDSSAFPATASSPEKKPVSLTSFHFTPAGEAPHIPALEEKPSVSSTSSPTALSPRERAEQRKQGRGNTPAPFSANTNNQPPAGRSPNPTISTPAHIRRRMGKVESGNESMEENSPASTSLKESAEDEDFKSLFGESKSNDKEKNKKKKKASEDDEEMPGEDGDEELELFEDEK